MKTATIAELLDELRAGRLVVILDDEDRENEGDLIMVAEKVRAEDINFMAREARGLICLALTASRCRQLGLKPMVADNTSPHGTAFTVSIEAASGVTTGISAFDRARTVQVAVKADAGPGDLTQPGHVFPLAAAEGGVLTRAGHTEAACDLAQLAGFEPAGVLVEIMHDDGSMARRPQLETFAAKHGLKIGTIADLIRHRLASEKTVERVHESTLKTTFGLFRCVVYRDVIHRALHFALTLGTVDDGVPVPVRVHVRNLMADVLHVHGEEHSIALDEAMRRVAESGRGAVVVIDGDDDAQRVLQRLALPPNAAPRQYDDSEWRQLGIGAQILADLGVRRLRVIGASRRFPALAAFGLEVVED